MKTVSLQLAKQLKEAGFPQDTYFYHDWDYDGDEGHIRRFDVLVPEVKIGKIEGVAASPTAEEILERLPWRIEVNDFPRFMRFGRSGGGTEWYLQYPGYDNILIDSVSTASLAEAAGKMWLYLKENKLL